MTHTPRGTSSNFHKFPMKILILNSARKFIGEAAHCLALAEQLRLRGHHATLAVRRGFELEAKARQHNVPFVSLTFNSGFHPLADGRDLMAIRTFLRKESPDVLHCHRGKDHWLAAAASIGRSRRPALVRTRHVVVPMACHPFNRWLLTGPTDAVIAVSGAAAASLGPLRSLLEGRLTTILSAVDQERFHPRHRSLQMRRELGAGPETLLVGLIARIQRIKGQAIFLQAAAKVAGRIPDLRFLIAGRGNDEQFARLRAQAEQLGIADRVEFRGWVDDIAATIASLDVGIVASLGSEGSSRITYECMASQVPVVATTVGGIPEIVRHGETGLLVPPADAEALAAAMDRLLTGAEERERLARAALAHVNSRHSFDRWIGDILDVYGRAVQRHRPREASPTKGGLP